MRVLVTAISFSSKISGIQRHAFNLVRCLLAHPEVSVVHLVIAPWQREMARSAQLGYDNRLKIHLAQLEPGSVSRNLWHYRGLPKLADDLQPDLVHLTYPVPIHASALRCAVVLTLHDLYPYDIPANFRFPHVFFNRLTLRQSLRNVDAIACVSDTTVQRLKQLAPAHACHNVVRIYNCVEPAALKAVRSPLPELTGKPFLLCVAQHRRNKNIPLLIRVFGSLLSKGAIHSATNLVIVGITGPETSNIHEMVAQRSLSRRVIFRDGLSDSELQWCYERCEALVVPSTIEGFGLPVAEGFLAGCRVICSNIPALREVGGDHCQYFALGPDEEEALAASIMASLMRPKPVPIELPHLSAQVLAFEYVKLYRKVLENCFVKVAPQSDQSELRDSSALREV